MSRRIERYGELTTDEKRVLLAEKLRRKISQSEAIYPLSHGQQALWFLYQLSPESVAYNRAFAWRIRSNLDIAALERAFQTLVDRHGALRTTFSSINGKPVQRVHFASRVHFEVENAAAWSEEVLKERMIQEAHRPFNLEQGPLLRVHL